MEPETWSCASVTQMNQTWDSLWIDDKKLIFFDKRRTVFMMRGSNQKSESRSSSGPPLGVKYRLNLHGTLWQGDAHLQANLLFRLHTANVRPHRKLTLTKHKNTDIFQWICLCLRKGRLMSIRTNLMLNPLKEWFLCAAVRRKLMWPSCRSCYGAWRR